MKYTQHQQLNNVTGRLAKATPMLMLGFVAILTLTATDMAHAGAGGTEFDEVWTTIKDWTQGTLGRIIAGALILVGIVGGIARQSLMAFAIGIGGGMGLYNSPVIVESIMGATLSSVHNVAPAVVHISNGLGI